MKKTCIKLFIAALAALILELFIFNFRTFESLTFSPVDSFTMTDSDGSILEIGQSIPPSEDGSTEIILDTINANAHNLYLELVPVSASQTELNLQLWARDEGNNQFYSLPRITIDPDDPGSHYIKLNLSGKAKSIKITVSDVPENTLLIQDIGINRTRPLDFSILRYAGIFIVLLLIYAIRPGSEIYKIPYQPKQQLQKLLIAFLLIAQLAVAAGITLGNETYCDPPWIHHYQYHELAVALSEGHFYLDIEPSQELMAMENPYDKNERNYLNVDAQWDTAYYEGKYYSYFGVLPVLVYYLPYYLMTGEAFPTHIGIIINCAAIIAGIYFLMDILVRKYFRQASVGLFAILQILLTLGSGLLLIVNPPTFYNMPVSMALALTVWGLYCWQRAVRENDTPDCRFLALGALFMALVAPCRPQMLVGSFLILPMLWKPFMKGLRQSKKTAVRQLIALALPYIIVAVLLMYYNYARFGSPFDFGANYNLTTNDMTHRGFHLDRLPFGLFMYLFQTPGFCGRAPFMIPTSITTAYQGTTIAETMYGGFLWFNLITGALLFFGNVKDTLRKKGLMSLCLLSVLLGIIVVCADIEMAGILQRYGCDFGFFLMLPAVITVLALHERAGVKKIFNQIIMLVFLFTGVINFLWLLAK